MEFGEWILGWLGWWQSKKSDMKKGKQKKFHGFIVDLEELKCNVGTEKTQKVIGK